MSSQAATEDTGQNTSNVASQATAEVGSVSTPPNAENQTTPAAVSQPPVPNSPQPSNNNSPFHHYPLASFVTTSQSNFAPIPDNDHICNLDAPDYTTNDRPPRRRRIIPIPATLQFSLQALSSISALDKNMSSLSIVSSPSTGPQRQASTRTYAKYFPIIRELPMEVVIGICGFLCYDCLKNMRRVCRSFRHLGEERLFRKLTVWLDRGCLEALQIFKSNPAARHTRYLVISSATIHATEPPISEYLKVIILQQRMRDQPSSYRNAQMAEVPSFRNVGRQAMMPSWTQKKVKQGWEEYQKHIGNNRAFVDGDDVTLLAEALGWFPTLKRVTVGTRKEAVCRFGEVPCGVKKVPYWGPAVLQRSILLSPTYFGHINVDEVNGRRQLSVFFCAAAKVSAPLNLTEMEIRPGFYTSQAGKLLVKTKHLEAARNMLRGMGKLCFNIHTESERLPEEVELASPLLAMMPNLWYMSILSGVTPHLQHMQLFPAGKYNFKNLETFHTAWVRVGEFADFYTFVHHHRQTLRHVFINCVDLTNMKNNPVDFFRQVRDISKLRTFRLLTRIFLPVLEETWGGPYLPHERFVMWRSDDHETWCRGTADKIGDYVCGRIKEFPELKGMYEKALSDDMWEERS